ncbi:MAG: hypothetical protein ACFFC7_20190 [Candidatus Hermodarchaeota archaeon]
MRETDDIENIESIEKESDELEGIPDFVIKLSFAVLWVIYALAIILIGFQ